ncbi:MAG: DUF3147 family protein [Deltaproteobacteria bacterium]|nr:DUF3147 family protein [Deltaproteobacteria bacterium]
MFFVFVKIFLSALIIAIASECAKRNTFIGALLMAIPLNSLLAIIWVYQDTHDLEKIIQFCHGVFWMVIPSLFFFLIFPFLIRKNLGFYISLPISVMVTFLIYWIYMMLLKKLGVQV